jgi:GntR family histidine utilization transcriptional repressor
MNPNQALPRYQRVKNHIYERVERGDWTPGHRVTSENDLVRELGVSRMTVNRALRELAAEGLLTRVQGVGTFVADQRAQSEVVQIRNIADEIRERGHAHRSDLRELRAVEAIPAVAKALGLAPGAKVFRSLVVHSENDVPIQVEDRYVNPATAPEYLDIDFTQITTNEYLVKVAPITEVRHVIEAVRPDGRVRKLLRIAADESCLRLFRQVWSYGVASSCAWLTYPGSRYRMVAQFTPTRPVALRMVSANAGTQAAPPALKVANLGRARLTRAK